MINNENIGYSHGAQGLSPRRPEDKEYMIGYKKGLKSIGADHNGTKLCK